MDRITRQEYSNHVSLDGDGEEKPIPFFDTKFGSDPLPNLL